MTNLLAIDLGTGNMKLAVPDDQGNSRLLTNSSGAPSTPTAVFLDGDRILLGREADNARFQDPDRGIREWKRHMGSDAVLAVSAAGKEYRARDCAEVFIADAKTTYENKTGEVLTHVVMGIPANYEQRQRQETKAAAEALGLEVVQLVHEPTAAALGNGVHHRGDGLYLIADLGQGTFDVNLVRVHGEKVTVAGTAGVPKLGGLDFSARLQEHALGQFEAEHGFRPTQEQHPLALLDLYHRVEQAKCTLSSRDSATIVVSCEGQMALVAVTQALFRDLCADLVERAMDCVSKCLDECGVQSDGLEEALAVGGASRMRMFREAIEGRLGVQPSAQCEADYAVALGCVIAGRMELERQGRPLVINGRRLPPIRLFAEEVTSHDIGVTALTEERDRQVNATILKKNTPIPCEHTESFQLAEPGQTDARIELLEGQADAGRDHCRVLGHCDLSGLPSVQSDPHQIDVTMRLDRSGMLQLCAQDTASGREAELSIEYLHQSQPDAEGSGTGGVQASA